MERQSLRSLSAVSRLYRSHSLRLPASSPQRVCGEAAAPSVCSQIVCEERCVRICQRCRAQHAIEARDARYPSRGDVDADERCRTPSIIAEARSSPLVNQLSRDARASDPLDVPSSTCWQVNSFRQRSSAATRHGRNNLLPHTSYSARVACASVRQGLRPTIGTRPSERRDASAERCGGNVRVERGPCRPRRQPTRPTHDISGRPRHWSTSRPVDIRPVDITLVDTANDGHRRAMDAPRQRSIAQRGRAGPAALLARAGEPL